VMEKKEDHKYHLLGELRKRKPQHSYYRPIKLRK